MSGNMRLYEYSTGTYDYVSHKEGSLKGGQVQWATSSEESIMAQLPQETFDSGYLGDGESRNDPLIEGLSMLYQTSELVEGADIIQNVRQTLGGKNRINNGLYQRVYEYIKGLTIGDFEDGAWKVVGGIRFNRGDERAVGMDEFESSGMLVVLRSNIEGDEGQETQNVLILGEGVDLGQISSDKEGVLEEEELSELDYFMRELDISEDNISHTRGVNRQDVETLFGYLLDETGLELKDLFFGRPGGNGKGYMEINYHSIQSRLHYGDDSALNSIIRSFIQEGESIEISRVNVQRMKTGALSSPIFDEGRYSHRTFYIDERHFPIISDLIRNPDNISEYFDIDNHPKASLINRFLGDGIPVLSEFVRDCSEIEKIDPVLVADNIDGILLSEAYRYTTEDLLDNPDQKPEIAIYNLYKQGSLNERMIQYLLENKDKWGEFFEQGEPTISLVNFLFDNPDGKKFQEKSSPVNLMNLLYLNSQGIISGRLLEGKSIEEATEELSENVWQVFDQIWRDELRGFLELIHSDLPLLVEGFSNEKPDWFHEGEGEELIVYQVGEVFPPEFLDVIRKKVFPDEGTIQGSQVLSSRFDGRGVLSLMGPFIDEEYIDSFREPGEASFLRLMMRYPNLSVKLYKAIIAGDSPSNLSSFTKGISGEIRINPELITFTSRKDIGLAQEFFNTYIEERGVSIRDNHEVIRAAVAGKYLPEKYWEEYMESRGLSAKYESWTGEKGEITTGTWPDVINDREKYAEENRDIYVYLNELGLAEIDFTQFRGITNNPEVVRILRSRDYSLDEMKELRDVLSIQPNHLHYLDSSTFLTLVKKLRRQGGEELAFYRTLLSNSPRSFSNAVGAVEEGEFEIDITDKDTQQRILEAIREIGNITPLLLREYVGKDDPRERHRFVERINEFRGIVLTKQPIMGYFADEDEGSKDLLAEFITLVFPGTRLESVKRDLSDLQDYTHHLDGFNIPEEGYRAQVNTRTRVVRVKEGESIDYDKLNELREVFPRDLDPAVKARFDQELPGALRAIIKTGGAFNLEDMKGNMSALMSIMFDDEQICDYRKTNFNFAQTENTSVFLERAEELLGIYFKDNYRDRLKEHLDQDEQTARQLAHMCSGKRLTQLVKNLSQIPERQRLEELVGEIGEARDTEGREITTQMTSELVAIILENKVLRGANGYRSTIKRERDKFEYVTETGGEIEDVQPFTGHISKNAASFFAKHTAGICTAGDLKLFGRDDHFHINLARDGVVFGNIQGYVIEYEGRRSLLFRGFNPSSSVLSRANAGAYVDGMLSIIRKFAEDNDIEDVFLSEQLGGWHALTNRVGSGLYEELKKRVVNNENKVNFVFDITSGRNIRKMYRYSWAT